MDISHGMLQPETPTWTPKEGRWCSSLRPSHQGPWDIGYAHASGGTLKHHGDIWKVSGFWRKSLGMLFSLRFCMLWVNQLSMLAFFSFLQKTTKTTTAFFLQAAACPLLEIRAVLGDRNILLCVDTPFFSIIKRKMNWKHIQRYKSPQSLWSETGEEPCWEIPRETWCHLCFPQAWYIDGERDRQGSSCSIFVHFWPCCWVCRTSTKLVPAKCMGDHDWTMSWPSGPLLEQGWKQHLELFLLFPNKSCPCCDELSGMHCKSSHPLGCSLAVIS